MDRLDFGLTPLRRHLPDPVFEQMLRRAYRVPFDDGQALQARGDEEPRLCIVMDGAVRLGRFQQGGAFNLVAEVGLGGHFGDVAIQREASTHNCYGVGRGEIAVIKISAVEELLENAPGFAVGLWRTNAERLNCLLELYDDARTLDITTRLAKVIYVHTGRGALSDGVACLQRDLAELLAVSQVSIGSALKELEKAELIETGYRFVKVKSKARLKGWLRQLGAT